MAKQRARDTWVYELKDGHTIVYYGISNSPEDRLDEHSDSNKRFTHMRVISVASSGPHHQDSGEAKIRESTAGVSRKPSSDCKACGCSSKHLCGLTAWNT